MTIRPIRNANDHAAALREIERLWNAPAGSPDADTLETWAILVDDYESKTWPVAEGDPVDILLYAIGDMGRSQAELAAVIGSASRASEILKRKRALTVEMIDKISKAWSIPVALLAVPYALDTTRSRGGKPKPRARDGRKSPRTRSKAA